MRRSLTVWLLVASLVFLAVGGLVGGIGMLVDPTGHALGMDEVLPLLPVRDYLLPGLFLLLVMAGMPLLLSYGLLRERSWAGTGTLILGVVLAVWLLVQGALIGFRWPIQYVTAVSGILIIALSLVLKLRRG